MTKLWKVLMLLTVLLGLGTGTALARSSSFYVEVRDGSVIRTVSTEAVTVEKFLKNAEIKLSPYDRIDKEGSYVVREKDVLTIDRAVPLTLWVDGVPKYLPVQADTVGDAVKELEARDGRYYILESPAAETPVKKGMEVKLITRLVRVSTNVEEIPCPIKVIEDKNLALGTELIETEGVPGKKQVTLTESLVGGEVVESKREEVILSQPTESVVRKGTNNVLQAMGQTLRYRAALKVRATAYTPFDPGCNGITATGTVATYGTLAVDPKVIPLGSRVYVPGYGFCTATDTGGAIKGNRIDVCYDALQDALNWGVKNLTVYILE